MTNNPQIKLSDGIFDNTPVVYIDFDFNWDILYSLQNYSNAIYNYNNQKWFIKKELFNFNSFSVTFGDKFEIDTDDLKFKKSVPERYINVLNRKRYSVNTISSYTHYFEEFMDYFSNSELENITPEEINNYILELIKTKNISSSQQNQRINAIKFYYEKVLQQDKQTYLIDRPFKARRLPDILSKDEIRKIISNTKNIKHKAILLIIYSAGLRRSELINLQITDIDSSRMMLKIRGGKGKKDRYSLLSESTLKTLREYFSLYRPKKWLFEGLNGNQYSPTSLQNILKKAALESGIKKRVYLHMLRHSFATHLLDQGTNIRLIQEILGHDSIKTTEIYTHVSNQELKTIKNPADDLFNT